MHRLLARQLQRHLGKVDGFSEEQQRFIDAVDAAYVAGDEDRALLERSMLRSSSELGERNAALTVAERKFRSIFENATEGIFQISVEGRLISANPAMARVLGYETPAELIAADDDVCLRRVFTPSVLADIAATPGPFEIGVEATRKDGVFLFLTVTVRAVREREKLVHFEGTLRDATRRRRAEIEREELHKKLVEASRRAGMAEVATGVLHNVGNVLNSINVSAALIARTLSQSKLPGLVKGARMLREHPAADLGRFLGQDPKGQKLPEYLLRLSEHLTTEQREMEKEIATLAQHLDHVKRVIAMQQGYAKASGANEEIVLVDVIEDAIRLQGASFERHGVTVVRELDPLPMMHMDKHQIIQILINLLTNAKQAMDVPEVATKRLTIRAGRVHGHEDRIFVEVRDTGVGIAPEHLTRIFSHGFTTKRDGHGFGLHGSALAAASMRGSLHATSEGRGRGSCFRLELPLQRSAEAPVEKAA